MLLGWISHRIIMAVCCVCAMVSGMAITLHAATGFIPEKVSNPWIVFTVGLMAGVAGLYGLVEAVSGQCLYDFPGPKSPPDTVGQKLYKAHNLIADVARCLDQGNELEYELSSAMNIIYLVDGRLPRNIRSYRPKGGRNGN